MSAVEGVQAHPELAHALVILFVSGSSLSPT